MIERGINNIFKQEGFRRISKPPLPQNPKPLLRELLSAPWKIRNLWVIGLSLGNFNWTIIKASRDKLLCDRAKNSVHPRISKLATHVGCDAFSYKIHDAYLGALLEADTSGRTFVSGYLGNRNDLENNDVFCSEPVNKLVGGLNFYLLNISEELKAMYKTRDISQEERQKRAEELEKLVKQEPEKINYALSEYRKIHKSSFIRDNENLGQLLCRSDFFWHENNLLYKAYAEPEKLEKDRVKLLFFQVGRFDLNPKTEDIWSPITSRKDYGVIQDIPF